MGSEVNDAFLVKQRDDLYGSDANFEVDVRYEL